MTTHSRDHGDLTETTASSLASLLLLTTVTSVIQAVTDGEVGRTFVLNAQQLQWEEAGRTCAALGGALATIDQLHVLPEMEYPDDWNLWVGLKVTSLDNMTWQDGSDVKWTNWHAPDLSSWTGANPACVSAMTSSPYSWFLTPCNKSLPSLCETPGGSCRFTRTEHASLKTFNDRLENADAKTCTSLCQHDRQLDCRSVEVNRDTPVCQLSSESRWTQPRDFITGERYWDYYHWTCVNGTYLDGVYVSPNGMVLPTTEAAIISIPVTTSTTTSTSTSTEATEDEVVCYQRNPPENNTREVEQEVEQLQTLGLTYKYQQKMKTKVSISDSRPSATYLGSLSVGIVLGLLGLVVVLDLISLPHHWHDMTRRGACCGKCHRPHKKKKKKQKQDTMRFTEFSERAPSGSRVSPLFIPASLAHTFSPAGDIPNLDVLDSRTSLSGADDPKLGLHLERIRRLEQMEGLPTGPSVCLPPLPPERDEDDVLSGARPLVTHVVCEAHNHLPPLVPASPRAADGHLQSADLHDSAEESDSEQDTNSVESSWDRLHASGASDPERGTEMGFSDRGAMEDIYFAKASPDMLHVSEDDSGISADHGGC